MKKINTLLALVFCLSGKAQVITTVVGTGVLGYSGDGGQAVNAEISDPTRIALDMNGNLFICDYFNNRIRKVDTSGIITTIAGNGNVGYCQGGFSGDGGPATSAKLNLPEGVALDAIGNIYIADWCNNRVRKIDALGIITTIAGNGIQGFSGDGGSATSAEINGPHFVSLDKLDNLYIADASHIRMINTAGIIMSIAGNGTIGYSGDGGPASSAELSYPGELIIDNIGNIYFTEPNTHHIRKIDTAGIIITIAGNGTQGYSGDGGPATNAELNEPVNLFMDVVGNIFFSDYQNNRIRKIDPSGTISTVIGIGTAGFSGDGGQATLSQLNGPSGMVIYQSDLYFADLENNRIRKVTNVLASGINHIKDISNQVNIYPNPSSTNFVIETSSTDKQTLQVFDINGKIVLTQTINGKANIDASNLAEGVYNLSLQNSNGVVNKRLVIVR